MNMMRTLILIPLLTTMLLAQDGAADLFYKAFWLEQAEGKADEAEVLYREVVDKHAKAPEAPRALLGIIRIRAAGGADLDEFVSMLERQYPDAKEQIEAARDLAAAQRTPFSPRPEPGDSPAVAKIKMLHFQLRNGEPSKETEVFLADLGVQAHPMLATLLREMEPLPVKRATSILLMQRTPEADAVIEQALRDDKALFRTVIVETVAGDKRASKTLATAIAGLYDGAPPLLRTRIVGAMGRFVETGDPAVFEVVRRGLDDPDPAVRQKALGVAAGWYDKMPDAVAAAFVARLEKDGGEPNAPWWALFYFVGRPGLAGRIEKLLVDGPYVQIPAELPADHPAWPILARVVVARRAAGKPDNQGRNVRGIRDSSPAGVAELIRGALRTDDAELVGWLQRKGLAQQLAPYVDELRKQALGAVYAGDVYRDTAAARALYVLGLEKEDWPAVQAVLDANKGKGLPACITQGDFLRAIGVERAVQLAGYATTAGDWHRLLENAAHVPNRSAEWLPFFEAVVPHTGASSARALANYARNWPELQPLIARHVIASPGEEWNWETPDHVDKRRERSGRGVLGACDDAWTDAVARAALYEAAADPRLMVGRTALKVAKGDHSEGATAALARALDSPWPKFRSEALGLLGERGVAAPLARFLEREGLSSDERRDAFQALAEAGDASYASVVRAYLDRRDPDSYRAWIAYFELTPKDAVDFALEEVGGKGPPDFRAGALRTLTKTSDPRRIDVFRRILRGGQPKRRTGDEIPPIDNAVYTVLRTVADQYLIELGEETLLHLRSPDQNIRATATAAVERLKFYAEAKKAFGN
jgi:HEAT repeat protein